MSQITFTSFTIPIPEPYNDKDDNKQRENFFYVLNQVLQQMKTHGIVLEFSNNTVSISPTVLTEIRDAIKDLHYNNLAFEFGAFRLVFDGRLLTIEGG